MHLNKNCKAIIIFTVCIIMCLNTISFIASAEDGKTEENVEIMANGGFEKIKLNGEPDAWGLRGGTFGTDFIIGTEKPSEGKNSLVLKTNDKSIYADQGLEGLVGGTEYKLTAMIKTVNLVSRPVTIKIEFYSGTRGKDTYIAGQEINKSFDTNQNKWQKVELIFKTPENACAATLLLRLFDGGEVWFDSISVIGRKTESAPTPTLPPADPIKLEEMNEGAYNLIPNNGFEKLSSDGLAPLEWEAYKKDWNNNPYISVDNQNAYEGKNCIRVQTESGGNPWVRIVVKDLKPNTKYQLASWIRSTSDKVAYKLEYYDINEISAGHGTGFAISRYAPPYSVEQWRQFAETFITPDKTRSAAIYLRLYAPVGSVSFDNVMFYETKQEYAKMETDEVFYYSDWAGNGLAEVNANINYYSELIGGSIDFSLRDSTNVIIKNNTKITDSGEAKFIFPLSKLSEKKKEYTIVADIKDINGKIVETRKQSVFKYDRPSRISEDGSYIIDGEVFNPVFAYHINRKYYPYCKEAGINVVQIGSFGSVAAAKEALDTLERNELKGIICLYPNMKSAGNVDNVELTKQIVSMAKDHPATFAYAVMDEPFLWYHNADEELFVAYKLIHDIDPHIPIYIAEGSVVPEKYSIVAKFTDIFCVDPYPGGQGDPETYVSKHVSLAQEAVKYRKPVYFIEQAFEYGGYFPTPNDSIHMKYQALFEGVKGMGFYEFDFALPEAKKPLNETELWSAFTSFYKYQMDDAFAHFSHGKYPTMLESKGEKVWYHGFVKDGNIHLVILNRTIDKINIEIKLESFNGSVKIEDFTANTISGDGSQINGNHILPLELTPRQALVLKIIPDKEVDFNAIKECSFIDLYNYPWARMQIANLYSKGIVNAITPIKYDPDANISRGDFAMFLIRTLGLSAETSANFTDVDPNSYYANEISIGKALGILKGVGDNSYNPDAEISRQDLITICTRGMRYTSKLSNDGVSDDVKTFIDADKIADYALEAVAAMVREGIIQGNPDGSINPLGNTTRAEASVIMQRILDK